MPFSDLTIVIPCKNEENYIGKLFQSLTEQTYDLSDTQIYVADANSTDKTREVIEAWQSILNISIIPGGYPSTGRNNGARLSTSKYILFLDADAELETPNLIQKSLDIAKKRRLECVTCYVKSLEPILQDMLFWEVNNLRHSINWITGPLAPGAFILFEREKFFELGGFDENMLIGEDSWLTNQVSRRRFGVVKSFLRTSGRRFEKDGHLKTMYLYVKTGLMRKRKSYLQQDHSFYWRD